MKSVLLPNLSTRRPAKGVKTAITNMKAEIGNPIMMSRAKRSLSVWNSATKSGRKDFCNSSAKENTNSGMRASMMEAPLRVSVM